MKSRFVFAAAIVLGVSAGSVLADNDQVDHRRCQAAIGDALGENTATRLYDIRHRRSGDRLVFKAIPQVGGSLMLDCWVYRNGGLSLVTRDGLVLLGPREDEAEQLTLSE
ncbi:MAG: hypothetical protein CME40_15290 [Haliea sp.]|nr:hypothetical protein [Haliea sp.]|tara:strand:+ start:57173 stop:57502 length:330 start_codon:yes stop_codon:yes gene_type:complete